MRRGLHSTGSPERRDGADQRPLRGTIRRCVGMLPGILVLGFLSAVRADDTRKVTLSTVKCRSIAMGGAFTSVRDDLSSLDFNPATFTLENSVDESVLHVFLNPLGPLLLLKNADELKTWTSAPAYLFQGVAISLRRIQIGLSFGTETLSDSGRLSRVDWFNGKDFQRNSHSSLGFSFTLAPRVSLGLAGEMSIREGQWKKARFGYRYGLQIYPRENLSVGMFYIDFPRTFEKERLVLERLDDATLNVGIAYSPFSWSRLACDIRNVSDDGRDVVREPHFGLEIAPWRHLSVETGYYRIWNRGADVYSVGIGILDQHAWIQSGRRYPFPRLVLRSAFVLERDDAGSTGWFFLSGSIRL
jgi:hypothetical protein